MLQISLESARVNAGLSRKVAAEMLSIHYQTLAKYELDSSDIPISLFNKMSELYGVEKDYIFLGDKYDLIRKIEQHRLQHP